MPARTTNRNVQINRTIVIAAAVALLAAPLAAAVGTASTFLSGTEERVLITAPTTNAPPPLGIGLDTVEDGLGRLTTAGGAYNAFAPGVVTEVDAFWTMYSAGLRDQIGVAALDIGTQDEVWWADEATSTNALALTGETCEEFDSLILAPLGGIISEDCQALTALYTSGGTLDEFVLWNSARGNTTASFDVDVDAEDHVVIAGTTAGRGVSGFIRKYEPDLSAPVCTHIFKVDDEDAAAIGVAVDPATGAIYATGLAESESGIVAFVAKFDPDCDHVETVLIDDFETSAGWDVDVADGTVFVAGFAVVEDPVASVDALVAAFDTALVEEWVTAYEGGLHEFGFGVTGAGDGGAFVTGTRIFTPLFLASADAADVTTTARQLALGGLGSSDVRTADANQHVSIDALAVKFTEDGVAQRAALSGPGIITLGHRGDTTNDCGLALAGWRLTFFGNDIHELNMITVEWASDFQNFSGCPRIPDES